MRYCGIVWLWNEGGIFFEVFSDGVRMEFSLLEICDFIIYDKVVVNEYFWWWLNLRIFLVNKSIVNSDIIFILFLVKLEFIVYSVMLNFIVNLINFIFEYDLFSFIVDFKIVVKRVISGGNDINSIIDFRIMKVIFGFVDFEGLCCVKYFSNILDVLSDMYFKFILLVYEFGVFLVILVEDFLVVGSIGKVFF